MAKNLNMLTGVGEFKTTLNVAKGKISRTTLEWRYGKGLGGQEHGESLKENDEDHDPLAAGSWHSLTERNLFQRSSSSVLCPHYFSCLGLGWDALCLWLPSKEFRLQWPVVQGTVAV